MLAQSNREQFTQWRYDSDRQRDNAGGTGGSTHHEQAPFQIEVCYAQANGLDQMQAATVLEQGDQARQTSEVSEECCHLRPRKRRVQARDPLYAVSQSSRRGSNCDHTRLARPTGPGPRGGDCR